MKSQSELQMTVKTSMTRICKAADSGETVDKNFVWEVYFMHFMSGGADDVINRFDPIHLQRLVLLNQCNLTYSQQMLHMPNIGTS